ncbi:cytochrome P450 monooxygenase pc-3 [Cyathus striatus]|nr:cytochrome P450 monooxygenase pc-3 [Cyathus striatus]
MKIQLSPGLSFLAKVLPFYIVTSALAYAFLDVLRASNIYDLPTWSMLAISVLMHPLYIWLHRYYSDFQDARKASALGAALVPKVDESSINITRIMLDTLNNGYPLDYMWGWMEKYGSTFEASIPFQRQVFTSDPGHIKAILATQFDNFEKGTLFGEQAHSLLGTGVFNSDGDMWKFHRNITRPFFARDRISDFEIFSVHTDEALKQAKERLDEGYPIDFQDLVSRFTLDSASEFLFGNNVESLSAGLAYPESSSKINSPTFENHPSKSYVSAFLEGQFKLASRINFGEIWSLTELFSDQISPSRKIVDEFLAPLMNNAIRKKHERKHEIEKEEAGNLLDYLVEQTEDTTVLMDELVNLLVAGRDTTASLLTFAVYMMAEHPEMARKLREEVLNTIGPDSPPTYDTIRDMKYLRAFLNEVLRIYTPVPLNGRNAKRDTVLSPSTPGELPLYIPAKTKCTYSVFIMHRREDLWGPDALEFDPDRFIDERLGKYLTPNPFIFSPFSAGPRICLGQQFAYQESSFFLVRLLQRFSSFTLGQDAQPTDSVPPKSWEGTPYRKGAEKVRPQFHLTMYVKGGLWVRMKEATAVESM